MSAFRLAGLAASAIVAVARVEAGEFFANDLVSSQFVSPFGSGLVTGSPDSGGLWLSDTTDPPSNLGNFVVGYSMPLIDGPGIDLRIYDLELGEPSDPAESANVFVSSDGNGFTLVGSIIGGESEGSVDIAGAFAGGFSFVRVEQTSTTESIDIDAVSGFHLVPEPGTAALLLIGAAALLRRRDTALV